jgi:hypothetical protein
MNYSIITTKHFDRSLKFLSKKYHSFSGDYEKFLLELLANPTMGDSLGGGAYKVRMAIASKGSGKSGGARVITCNVLVSVTDTDIYLLTIYDKGERSSISKEEIKDLKIEAGLS